MSLKDEWENDVTVKDLAVGLLSGKDELPCESTVSANMEVTSFACCWFPLLLPQQNPDLPADVFTACLTTPIRVALRWFCSRSLLRHEGLTKEVLERIPGRQTDRKTPLGELNWIFTAITDTIAWNCLPRALFQKLFRQVREGSGISKVVMVRGLTVL